MADKIMQLVSGFSASRVLYTFTKLGVVDIIASAGHSLSAEEIAQKVGPDYQPQPFFRMLRFAASLGLLEMHDGPLDNVEYHKTCKFDLNETSQLLREGTPMRNMVLYRGSDALYALWGGFGGSLKDGKSASAATLGVENFWDYLQQDEEANTCFNLAMSAHTARQTSQVLSNYDFTKVTSVADIGGGLGSQLFAILKAFPQITKGHLFEIPSVIEKVVVPDDLKDRVELHAGSFLAAEAETNIPTGVDLYLLKSIIHDWADDEARRILQATRRSMGHQSKMLVIECVVPPGNEPSLSKALDLHMMVVLGAKERTEEEHRQLLQSAGLELTQVLAPQQQLNLIEARPAVAAAQTNA